MQLSSFFCLGKWLFCCSFSSLCMPLAHCCCGRQGLSCTAFPSCACNLPTTSPWEAAVLWQEDLPSTTSNVMAVSSSTQIEENLLLKAPPKAVIPTPLRIGFLGLGIMGQGMVMNLLRSGHEVTVWNRTGTKVSARLVVWGWINV